MDGIPVGLTQATRGSGGLEITRRNHEDEPFELKPTHTTHEVDYLI